MSILAVTPPALAFDAFPPDTDLGPDLNDDEKDACSALLCLAGSASQRGSDCNPPLDRYYSIKKKKLSDTLDARRSFLRICPKSDTDPTLSLMVRLFSEGAGRCDAAELNRNEIWEGTGGDAGATWLGISDKMPDYCSAMYNIFAPDYYRTDMPIYVGTMGVDGHWVDQ